MWVRLLPVEGNQCAVEFDECGVVQFVALGVGAAMQMKVLQLARGHESPEVAQVPAIDA